MYSQIILGNIHVFHSVDCCLTQGFAGHSGLFSPAQGLQFQWTLSLRVVCLSVPPLSLRVFGWHVLYTVSRFTCIHTKTMRGNFERPGEFWDLGLSLKYVSRNFNQFEKSHSFWNMHAELRQLELYQNVSLKMTSIVRLCGLSTSILGSEQ